MDAEVRLAVVVRLVERRVGGDEVRGVAAEADFDVRPDGAEGPDAAVDDPALRREVGVAPDLARLQERVRADDHALAEAAVAVSPGPLAELHAGVLGGRRV